MFLREFSQCEGLTGIKELKKPQVQDNEAKAVGMKSSDGVKETFGVPD